MDKLHERKMNDSYKSPNGKCLEKFEFVKKFELVEQFYTILFCTFKILYNQQIRTICTSKFCFFQI